MKVTRTSAFTGQLHVIDLPVTPGQLLDYDHGYLSLQDAFPDLEPWQREFIMNGVTKQEWDDCFGRGASDRNTAREQREKANQQRRE